MPRARWGREGGFGGGALPRRIARFLEPCLLLLLREDAAYGYNLLDALRQFGFTRGTVDPSVVYRILREMEDAGGAVPNETHPFPGRRVAFTPLRPTASRTWLRGSTIYAARATRLTSSSRPTRDRPTRETLLYRRSSPARSRYVRNVSVYEATCTGCGECVDACPTEAITLADGLAHIDDAA